MAFASIHALASHGGVVLLQLNRYRYAAGFSRKDSSLVAVEPGACIQLPVFTAAAGLEVVMERFIVGFVIFHIGDRVDHGHYQAALCYSPASSLRPALSVPNAPWEYRICNDACKPRVARQADLTCINHNTYLIGLVHYPARE